MTARGFEGEHAGVHYSSLYPHLYRVRHAAMIGGRRYDVDKLVTATSEAHARGRASSSAGATALGAIDVSHVATLEEVSR